MLPSDTDNNDHFGFSVAISGDRSLIGSPNARGPGFTSPGAGYIFHRIDTVWTEQAKLADSTGWEGMFLGYDVSINGDFAIIGATEDNVLGSRSGSAYIFHGNGMNWTKSVKLLASDGSGSDLFGWSVFIDDSQAIVGAPVQDNGGLFSGAVYVYTGFAAGISAPPHSTFPENFSLKQNYPNPFNPSTVISWQLAVGSVVNLAVYDLSGRLVMTLVNEHQPVGYHQVQFDASHLASGIYLYRLQAGYYRETRKMVVMK